MPWDHIVGPGVLCRQPRDCRAAALSDGLVPVRAEFVERRGGKFPEEASAAVASKSSPAMPHGMKAHRDMQWDTVSMEPVSAIHYF